MLKESRQLSNQRFVGASNGSMTTMGQTLREVQRPTSSIVTPKDTLVMGHWNVRSLYRGGKTAQVAREMEGYKLDNDCAVALGWRPEGREAEADPKLPGVAL